MLKFPFLKRLILSFFFVSAIVFSSLGQVGPTFPNTISQSNASTKTNILGGLTSLGYQAKRYTDSASANAVPYLKNTPNTLIVIGDTLYIRNTAATRWLKIASSTVVPPSVYYGVDSVTSPSIGNICVWSQGLSNCFAVTSPVTPDTSVDSVIVTGDQICVYSGATAVCYTVSTVINNITNLTTYIDTTIVNYITQNNFNNGIDSGSALITGSIIIDTGFKGHTTSLYYKINGRFFTIPAVDSFFISPATGQDRYTQAYVDTLGNFGLLDCPTGSPVPVCSVDNQSQLIVATYFIPAFSTTPQGISNEAVYKEHQVGEWVVTGTARINPDYLTGPFEGLKSLYDTSLVANSYIYFTDGTTHRAADFNLLSMYLKLKGTFANTQTLTFSFMLGNSVISSLVQIKNGTYGYSRTSLLWQPVAVTMNDFQFFSGTFDRIRIQISGASASGFQLDNVVLQAGGVNQSTNIVKSVNNQTDHVYLEYGDTLRLNLDSTQVELWHKGTSRKLASVPTFLKYLRSTDPCLVLDTIGKYINISINPTCLSGGGGSYDYVQQGYGVRVDSSGRLYTVRADSSVMASQARVTAGLSTKFNTSDTTGKWVQDIYSRSDSLFKFKNGVETFVRKDSVGAGGGSGVQYAQSPLVIKGGDTVSRRFNVLDYLPGFISGVTDATAGIQAAINACDAAGGGEVFFPNSIYIIGGAINATYNSQLYIPAHNYFSASRNHITLKGESSPSLLPVGTGLSFAASMPIASSPVVLKSSLTTFSTAGQAIIGTSLASGTPNETFLTVENIAFQVKNNPSSTGPVVGGINYENGASLIVKKVVVYVDTSGYRSTLPSNDVTGIETPDNNAETFNSIEDVLVIGMRNGYKLGEHTVLNQAQSMTCYNAFNLKAGYHTSSAYRVGAFWCVNDIYISGFCTLAGFQMDTEWKQDGSWFDDAYTIKDTANLATGNIFYTIIVAGIGKDNSKFTKSGGANLNSSNNDNGFAILSNNTYTKSGMFSTIYNQTLGSANTNIQFQKAGSSKWGIGMDATAGNYNDFYIYDYHNNKYKLYFNATNGDMWMGGEASNPATAGIAISSANAIRMSAYTAGTATFDGSGNITSSSDRRVKRKVEDYKYGLAAIMKLRTRTFIYDADKTNTVMTGFIAQEVQDVIPGAVHKGNDKKGTLSLETNAILAAAVNAIKELSERVEALEKENKVLKTILKK